MGRAYERVNAIVLVPIPFFPLFFELPAATYLGLWVLGQVFSGTLSLGAPNDGGVAWWAHVGGFLAGVVLCAVFVRGGAAHRAPSRDEYRLEGAWLPYRYWRNHS